MKKGILSLMIMLITIALLMTTANATFTANVSMKSDSTTTKVGDTVTLTISTNEKVIASNFDISYDSTMLKLEGSGTNYLSVAEKDGKIACIYADMSGTGTSEFKVKFKASKETTGTSLKIENAKFRAEEQNESYTGEQITGINNAITVKVVSGEGDDETPSTKPSTTPSTTTSKTSLPKTGKETGVIIAGIIVLVIIAVVFGKKSKELSKIFSSLSVFVIALVIVTALDNSVYAKYEPKILTSGKLSNGEKYIGLMKIKDDPDRRFIVVDLTEPAQGILNVVNDKKESLSNEGNDLVKTGYYLTKDDGEYKIVIYGDANGDGIICDTDDIMVIINDYLGKKNATELEKLAANLDIRDEKLDSDDLIQMINMYLGILNNDLVVKNIEVVGKWEYTTVMKDGKEVTENIFGSSAIGSPGCLEFKEDGTFVNDFPGATSIELEDTGKYSLNGKNIKLQFTKESIDLTYNSEDGTISYPYGEYTLILKKMSEDEIILEEDWEYSLESDKTIILTKYIGKDSDVTIKQSYSIDGTQYNTRMGESRTAPNYEGPFMNNTTIKNITFESTDVFGTNVSYMFFNCTNLERVIGFGGNITDMNSCFSGCTSLKNQQNKNNSDYVEGAEINIPDTVRTMNYAFNKCTSIEYLPSIGSNSELVSAIAAFKGCSGAKSGTIYLNSTVTYINEMFKGCSLLGIYTGYGFRIYSYMEKDKVYTTDTFTNCGVQHAGGVNDYKPHEFIVKNATSETDENYIFFKELIKNASDCSLTVKLAE